MNLKVYCKYRNIPLKDLAAYCGVTPQAITGWANGSRLPENMETFRLMLEFLGLSQTDVEYKKPLWFPDSLLENEDEDFLVEGVISELSGRVKELNL